MPPEISSQVQRPLFAEVRAILKRACFRFAQRRRPEILEHKGWTCAESVGLDEWAAEFRKAEGVFPNTGDSETLPLLLQSMKILHQTTSYDNWMEAADIVRVIADAEAMAGYLEKPTAKAELGKIRQDIEALIEELAQKRKGIMAKLEAMVDHVAAQRAEMEGRRLELMRQRVQLSRFREDTIMNLRRVDYDSAFAICRRFAENFALKRDALLAKVEDENDDGSKPDGRKAEFPQTISADSKAPVDAVEHDLISFEDD